MNAIPPPNSTPDRDAVFLDKLERELASLDRRIKLSDLMVYTGQGTRGARALRERLAAILLRPRMLDWIAEARARVSSPTVIRRFELLRRYVVHCDLEHAPSLQRERESLQRSFSGGSPRQRRHHQDRNALYRTLCDEKDRRKRERAFRAIGGRDPPLERRVRSLLQQRIEHARAIGQGSLVSARLAMEGLTLGQWNDLTERLVPIVRARLRGRRARFQDLTGERGWYPWDERYLNQLELGSTDGRFPAERALANALRAARGWGFPRRAFGFTTRTAPIPFGGYAVAIRAPDDVRVIIHPGPGWHLHRLVCHEVGHAIHARLGGGGSFLLRSVDFFPSYGGFLEGVGILFERAESAPGWLSTVPRLSEAERHEVRDRAEERFWCDLAMTLVHAETEVQSYLHPERDPSTIRNRLEREVYGYDAFEPWSWAHAILVESPLYMKSYVLGAIFATQALAAGLREVGGELWPNPRLGPWLTENWFRPGAMVDWIPQVAQVTGRPFGVQNLAWNLRV